MSTVLRKQEKLVSKKWNPYPAYKDSGVELFGAIPEHWDAKRLKYLSKRITKGTTPSTLGGQFVEQGVAFVKVESITSSLTVDSNKCARIEISTHKQLRRSQLWEGDLLVGIAGAIGRVAVVSRDLLPANTNQAVGIVSLRNSEMSSWVAFCLTSISVQQSLLRTTVASAQSNLSLEDLGLARIPSPSPEEAVSITNFLDRETIRIDELIAKKERQIELLNEKRQTLITHAVTKGLNPNVKMKDSGVEWLGEVPEHWDVMPLKRVASLKSGDSIDSSIIDETGDFPVYGGNGLRGYTSRYSHSGTYPLIGRQGALCGNVNYANGKFWASEHAVVVSPLRPVKVRWLGELLSTMNLNQYSVSAAQPGLSVDVIANLHIPVPALEEQEKIASVLDGEISLCEAMSKKIHKSNAVLREYRSALISAAVTGKIDVRNEAS